MWRSGGATEVFKTVAWTCDLSCAPLASPGNEGTAAAAVKVLLFAARKLSTCTENSYVKSTCRSVPARLGRDAS